ncbi:MAG: cation-transporting P-type ATPase [Pseudonocardiales bacterium]|jgi:magnesium-transporting ATPase (P-type)|nr:cation-transporting P-type ATPase [Pseudonocardiales bacterium]
MHVIPILQGVHPNGPDGRVTAAGPTPRSATTASPILFVIGAALLSLGRYSDALISVGLGLVNAVISTAQEIRAKRKLDSLQLLDWTQVVVVRDGRDVEIGPHEVVRGDVLRVAPGDQIVVDGPLLDGDRVEADESLLTGESDPVVKGPGDDLRSGSVCVAGEGRQLARDVGAASYAGRLTLDARQDTTDKTRCNGASSSSSAWSWRVQQVNAVESVSNVDVVCTDTTGTLTTGRLTLKEVEPLDGQDPADVDATLGALARSATTPKPHHHRTRHSRAVAGYAVNLGAPSALNTARNREPRCRTSAPRPGLRRRRWSR